MPKNVSPQDYLQFFKSKQFIVTAKGILFQQLHEIINQTNKLDISFERIKFQFYKGFIGKGNNTPLVVQIFKNHRWWWTIYQSLSYDEEGKPILPYFEMKSQNFNMNLYKETFAEHNFLWTQWKKLKHFSKLS